MISNDGTSTAKEIPAFGQVGFTIIKMHKTIFYSDDIISCLHFLYIIHFSLVPKFWNWPGNNG